jgi:predicted ferric reductase
LHKWLGVAALVMVIAHWLWVPAPGWLASLEVVARRRPAEGPAVHRKVPIHDFIELARRR